MTEQMEQIQEPTLSDGQTDNLPPPPPTEQMEQIPTEQIPTESGSVVSDTYTQDEFFDIFKSVFQYAGDLTGTKSLPITEQELYGARATSNRLYEMAEKYAFMRPLIKRNTSRIMETILILQFIGGKAQAVYKEKTSLNLGGVIWKKTKKILGIKPKVVESESLVQVVAEKPTKAESLSETQTV